MQADRQDKSAVGWEEKEKVAPHESQTGIELCTLQFYATNSDYKKGFGGQYGVQKDRQDKSAVGWDEHSALNTHESQTG